MKNINYSIFRFRQDLRINDNFGLIELSKVNVNIIPVFIFDKNILDNFPNNDKRIGFLISAIQKLELDLKNIGLELILYYGDPKEIFQKIIKKFLISQIYCNKSYGLYGKNRDKIIEKICNEKYIEFRTFDDYLLIQPNQINPKKVFTPYYRIWSSIPKIKPVIFSGKIKQFESIYNENDKIIDYLTKIYGKVNKYRPIYSNNDFYTKFNYCDYGETRNLLNTSGTSRLSPYIRFGLISIRQIYEYVSCLNCIDDTYIKELAWRDYWHHINHHFPESYFFEFQIKKRKIKWENNETKFEARKEGKTGYPIVDAGMRQLKLENWMHNRLRMIVGSFLTKNLHIDRRWGETHFKNYLIDYDSNVNIGNWQWIAGVGSDTRPLRIFNPILQSKKFDKNCEYIKNYVIELENEQPNIIHDPIKNELKYSKIIVNHYESAKEFKNIYYQNS